MNRNDVAPLTLRFGAAVLDSSVVGSAPFAVTIMSVGLRPSWLGAAVAAWAFAALFGYQMLLVGFTGQTLGKRWVGIEIVTLDRQPPGFVRGVVLRYLLPVALPLALLAMAAMFATGKPGAPTAMFDIGFTAVDLCGFLDALLVFSPTRRTLRDRIAGTVVVPAFGARMPARHMRWFALAAAVTAIPLVLGVGHWWISPWLQNEPEPEHRTPASGVGGPSE